MNPEEMFACSECGKDNPGIRINGKCYLCYFGHPASWEDGNTWEFNPTMGGFKLLDPNKPLPPHLEEALRKIEAK